MTFEVRGPRSKPTNDPVAAARLGARGLTAAFRRGIDTVVLWHRRARQRRQLSMLDDRLFRDMGVRALDARKESRKPFWCS